MKLGEQLARRRPELKMNLEGLLAVELGARYLALNACDAPDWQQQPELVSPAGVTQVKPGCASGEQRCASSGTRNAVMSTGSVLDS